MDYEIDELDAAGLRRFALVTAGLLVGLFGIALPLLQHRALPFWPWIIAILLLLGGVFLPERLRLVYRGWMMLAMVLGKINSTVLLSILYILLICPVGMLMRLLGTDPLQRKRLPQVLSYRNPSVTPQRNQMEKPY